MLRHSCTSPKIFYGSNDVCTLNNALTPSLGARLNINLISSQEDPAANMVLLS